MVNGPPLPRCFGGLSILHDRMHCTDALGVEQVLWLGDDLLLGGADQWGMAPWHTVSTDWHSWTAAGVVGHTAACSAERSKPIVRRIWLPTACHRAARAEGGLGQSLDQWPLPLLFSPLGR